MYVSYILDKQVTVTSMALVHMEGYYIMYSGGICWHVRYMHV